MQGGILFKVISGHTPIFGNLTPTFGTHTPSPSTLGNPEAAMSNRAIVSLSRRALFIKCFKLSTFTSWRKSLRNPLLSWSLIASHSWSLIATIIQRCSRTTHFKTRTNIFKKTRKSERKSGRRLQRRLRKPTKATSASQSSRDREDRGGAAIVSKQTTTEESIEVSSDSQSSEDEESDDGFGNLESSDG